MRNTETLIMTMAGVAMIYGVRYMYRELIAFIVSFRYPDHRREVPEWTYCIAGDHMARSTEMAWYGDAFICDGCVAPHTSGAWGPGPRRDQR